jgi:hypothetical protein
MCAHRGRRPTHGYRAEPPGDRATPEEQSIRLARVAIARRDPGYRDVADRLGALDPSAVQPKGKPPQRAVNDDDDFERAFDDLFEGKS